MMLQEIVPSGSIPNLEEEVRFYAEYISITYKISHTPLACAACRGDNAPLEPLLDY